VLELVTLQKNLEKDGRLWMRFVYLLLNYHNNVYLSFTHYFNNQHITIKIFELRMPDRNMLTKPPNKKSLMIKPWKNIGKFDRISMYRLLLIFLVRKVPKSQNTHQVKTMATTMMKTIIK